LSEAGSNAGLKWVLLMRATVVTHTRAKESRSSGLKLLQTDIQTESVTLLLRAVCNDANLRRFILPPCSITIITAIPRAISAVSTALMKEADIRRLLEARPITPLLDY